MKIYILVVMLLLGGCVHRGNEMFSVLGENIQLPITIGQAKQKYHLNEHYPGRLFRINPISCKSIVVCFQSDELIESPNESKVWGVNIIVNNIQGNTNSIIKQVEQELDVSFKPDTSKIFIPYWYANKGDLQIALRYTNGMPYVATKANCFSDRFKEDKVTLYLTYGLSQFEFETYVSSDGTHLEITD